MDTSTKNKTGTGSASTEKKADSVNELYRSDYELVQRARNGDQNAASEIVEQHQKNVYNLGLRLGGNESEAECILQDTFLKVFEKLELFKGNSRLGTWIHRIATNEALMRMRSRKGKYFVTIEEEIQDNQEDKGNIGFIAKSLDRDPLELTLDEELRQKLEQAISTLPSNLRTAFVLKDLEGLSMAEIGERTEKTVSAIKADLHRARVKLRKKLAEFVEEKEHGKL